MLLTQKPWALRNQGSAGQFFYKKLGSELSYHHFCQILLVKTVTSNENYKGGKINIYLFRKSVKKFTSMFYLP
jgi:hypothetical protein